MRVATAARLETAAQGGSAAAIGAWAGSVTEPPNGAQWGLLVAAAGLAFLAGWFHYQARDPR